jgi:diguanylate cyclase (GGDEF)-like protein/PAS domain S-box-containing protein
MMSANATALPPKHGAPQGGYQRRFMAAAVPAILAANLAVALLFGLRVYATMSDELKAGEAAAVEKTAATLGASLTGGAVPLEALLAPLAAKPDFAGARVLDPEGVPVALIGRPDEAGHRQVAATIPAMGDAVAAGHRLIASFATDGQRGHLRRAAAEAALLAAGATALTTLILLLLNRTLLVGPLTRARAAIDAAATGGGRGAVGWVAADEVGALIDSFNAIQARMAEADARRRLLNERLSLLYNRTPAMLHSVDRLGQLVHVSDHWLIATGYQRRQVIGQPLTRFLTPESAIAYEAETLPRFLATGQTAETQLQLVRADGSLMDVVLSETADNRISPDHPLSLSVMSDITRTKSAERELARLAATDAVTGLANRRGFLDQAERAIAALTRHGGEALVVCLDLDRFKRVNDTHGHAAGDALLRAIADRLARVAGPRAVVGRLGGDEFAVLMVGPGSAAGAEALGERLLTALRQPVDVGNAMVDPSGSVGFASYPDHGRTAGELLEAADLALYRAKATGRNRVERFDATLGHALADRREQEADLRAALEGGWFELFLQPIVDLSDGSIVGGEALLRMRHPSKGLLMPAPYVAAAEDCGLSEPLGRFVIEAAARLVHDLTRVSGRELFLVSVNVSAGQIGPSLVDQLGRLVRDGLDAGSLVLEIMEAAFLDDAEDVTMTLDAVATLGYRIALDDFGTGYSSLNNVNRFPVSVIKLDRSFTRALGDDRTADRRLQALVRTTVTLGTELKLPIVAEGIERTEEMERTIELGIGYGQGYLFAPPLPVAAFRELVAAGAPIATLGPAGLPPRAERAAGRISA